LPAPRDPAAEPGHAAFAAGFAAALAGDGLPDGTTARDPGESGRRFAVYRNNVAVSLTAALAQRFPVIARLVGEAFFQALARLFARQHRPESTVLLAWGARFPAFLEEFPPLAAYPYMADVARIEVARGEAFHAADAEAVPPAVLLQAAAEPELARLALHPSVRLLRLGHPAVSIWTANQPGGDGRLSPGAGPETALVLRTPDFEVPVVALGPGDAALVGALAAGATLGAAAAAGGAAEPRHDPQPLLLYLMRSGAIVTPRPEERP
jgi:hypothetical protein